MIVSQPISNNFLRAVPAVLKEYTKILNIKLTLCDITINDLYITLFTGRLVNKDASVSFTHKIVQYCNISSIFDLAGAAFKSFI